MAKRLNSFNTLKKSEKFQRIETPVRPETMLVIGLTGAVGSGCTFSAEHLRDEHAFHHVSLSTILKAQIGNNRITSRERLQDEGNRIRREKGPHTLMSLAIQEMGNSVCNRTVIETMRNPFEVEYLLNNVPNAYIVALYASEKERLRRTHSEAAAKKERFRRADIRDSGENEDQFGQQVTECVNLAQYFIDNEGNEQQLKDTLDKFVSIISGKEDHLAKEREILMSHAFMERLSSKCLSRRVGAVIAKEGIVISTGSNNTPKGSPACRECHRKRIRRCTHCEADLLGNVGKCPSCAKHNPGRKKVLVKHLDLCYAVHAEEKAILNATKMGTSLSGATIYCTTFPCLLCAKMIADSGITHLVYVEPYESEDSKEILENAHVECERFTGFTAHRLYGISVRRDGQYA